MFVTFFRYPFVFTTVAKDCRKGRGRGRGRGNSFKSFIESEVRVQ